jgi:hypothetical protein
VLERTGKRVRPYVGAEVPTAVTTDSSFYRPGYNAVEVGESQVTFRRTPFTLPAFKGLRERKTRNKWSPACCLLHAGFLLAFFDAEGGGYMLRQNAG